MTGVFAVVIMIAHHHYMILSCSQRSNCLVQACVCVFLLPILVQGVAVCVWLPFFYVIMCLVSSCCCAIYLIYTCRMSSNRFRYFKKRLFEDKRYILFSKGDVVVLGSVGVCVCVCVC